MTESEYMATPAFDENWYRLRYPDVAEAIARGQVSSAFEHYERHGREEGREPVAPPAAHGKGEMARQNSYQTFPGETGDSDSKEKLRSLKLPDFKGKSVLDVGCNEGLFCFEAASGGAASVLGIDRNPSFIARAQSRKVDLGIPSQLDFVCQSWEKLPDAKFDLIFLLSALHYAEDQPALIRRLTENLTPRGVLVLECGVVDDEESALVEVKRSVDVVSFPTFGKIKEWLSPYAWKLMGPSVQQKGDPISRKVFHIQNFRREVLLLLGPGHTGKTTFARILARPGIPNVMIDDHLCVYYKTRLNGTKLSNIIRENYDGQRIDHLYSRILADGALNELIDDIATALDSINAPIAVVEGALGQDTAISSQFAKRLESRGFYVWLCCRP
jgi:2-polyprenyl-3-methyl-5-hydroxy-6-metoxy-1,4-benzoquinol methylase